MKRKRTILLVLAAVLAGALIVAAYFLSGGAAYSTDMNELRARFNRDKGKVRLVLLLSPT